MRLAFVNKDHCKAGVDCPYICIDVCPVNRSGGECIIKTEDGKVLIQEELCIGCGICVKRCPFKAISIFNVPEELTQRPIHRYGKNGFILYNLPIPLFNRVVGVLGVNGIGKSTAVKILAKVLIPNLGGDKEASFDELLEFFKGSEAQSFFEKLRNDEIKLSYKPQSIDLLPKVYDGKVMDLLKRVSDDEDRINKIINEFSLGKILNRNIKDLSGGELQRLAIAATTLKKAQLYIFDEPTSYLDIKQRIKVAKLIRQIPKEDVGVLTVEHDLIILDYMTDLVSIMFGKPGCYGIVAMPKTTRQGINEYLQGFLVEENMRIREKPILFFEKPPAQLERTEELTSWNNITKKLDGFELKAESGVLFKNQVVGVLGENGIGKTTFIKILAGIIRPDSGNIKEVKVAYKPQYLNETIINNEKDLVMNFLHEAIKNYNVELIRPLNIQPLFTKKLDELSGGELQRVLIAKALSEDAELYLLDEPSAYLDVDQRVIVAKVIRDFIEKNKKTALVVDHDLLFIDMISESLLIFDGEPAVRGFVKGPLSMHDGMNYFLKKLGITLRRDLETKRPRINKEESRKDREQKKKGEYYYA